MTAGGLAARAVGRAVTAATHHITVHELTTRCASLEEAFMELTRDSVDYHAGAPADRGKVA